MGVQSYDIVAWHTIQLNLSQFTGGSAPMHGCSISIAPIVPLPMGCAQKSGFILCAQKSQEAQFLMYAIMVDNSQSMMPDINVDLVLDDVVMIKLIC